MNEKIVNKSMILLMGLLSNKITYTGRQIKQTAPTKETAKKVFFDDLSVLEETPSFSQIKVGVIAFRNKISSDSSLFGSFFEKTESARKNHDRVFWVYDYKNDYAKLAAGLGDSDALDVYLLETQCFGSLSAEMTREIEEIKTSCGTKKAVKPDKSWNISLSGWYEKFSEKTLNTSLTSLMLASHMDMTIERKQGLRSIHKADIKEFLVFSLFMDYAGEGTLEGWMVFKGHPSNITLGQSTDNAHQAYTASFANTSEPYLALGDYSLLGFSDTLTALEEVVARRGNKGGGE